MNWTELNNLKTLESIKQDSFENPVLIFKHSIRCGTSALVIDKLERSWNSEDVPGVKTYYLDLIRNREISNQIEADFGVYHESPQVLIISQGKAVYNASHYYINYSEILEQINKLTVKE